MSFVVTAVIVAVEVGTVAAIATAVTYVGIAMTVVGTVTKSKELTKVGRVLSIGGGIASLGAAAYGAYSAAGSGAVSSTAAGAGGDSLWSEAANQATADASANVATEAAEQVTADTFAGAANSAADTAIGAAEGIGASGTSGGLSSGFDATANLAGDAGQAAGVSTSSAAPAATGFGEDVAAEKWALAGGSDAAGSTFGSAITKPGIGQGIMDWYSKLSPGAKTQVNTTLLQAGGSAVGGLFNGWSASQKLDLEKQLYQDQIKRANAMPTISFKSGLVANSTKGG